MCKSSLRDMLILLPIGVYLGVYGAVFSSYGLGWCFFFQTLFYFVMVCCSFRDTPSLRSVSATEKSDVMMNVAGKELEVK